MFKILSAELLYYKTAILFYTFLLSACFITIWFGVRIEANQVPPQMLILLVTVFSLGNIHGGFFVKSKRMRYFNGLPLSRSTFADLRFLCPVVIWTASVLILFALIGLFSIIFPDLTRPSLPQLFLLNGIIMITQSIYLFNIDVRHLVKNRLIQHLIGALYVCVFLAVLVPFYIQVNFAGLFDSLSASRLWLTDVMHSSKAALFFNLVGYVCYRASIYTYFLRRDYLE